MFTFHCQCGKKLAVRDNWAGKRVKCPECERSIVATPESEGSLPNAGSIDATPPVPGIGTMGFSPLSATPSPLSYANADLPRKGAIAPAGSGPAGKPRSVFWFLFVSSAWLVINVLFVASFFHDLNGHDPNFIRPLLLAIGWFITGLGVLACWLVLVYTIHKDVRNLTGGGYDISPAKAVGFSFIPGFSAFWIVYMPSRLAGELNRHLIPLGPPQPTWPIIALQVASIPLGLLLPALAPILYSITLIRLQRALNQIWLGAAPVHPAATAPGPAPESLIVDPA
jgi:hypothetical protein